MKVFFFLCFSSFLFSVNIDQMTLEEKAGQVLMAHFHGNTANHEASALINYAHVGGIIYYTWSNSLDGPEQVRNLSQGLQGMAAQTRLAIPLLIATDQEGGKICRLTNGFTLLPPNRTLGQTNNPLIADFCAYICGLEMNGVGINMNLAPVVDIDSNPVNPVIGARSFGHSPSTVVQFGRAVLQGYHRAGILTCLKHYPGHGDSTLDSHLGLPVINKSLQELRDCELIPFFLLASETDAIMTAHILIPSIDQDHCATLSYKILQLLREQGFQGPVISDSLTMKSVLDSCKGCIELAAIEALNAGCDILLLGGQQLHEECFSRELTVDSVIRIQRSIITAVESGRLSAERLDEAVQRIIDLKTRFCKF
jgi:beta-N-acetylhexosaminidase